MDFVGAVSAAGASPPKSNGLSDAGAGWPGAGVLAAGWGGGASSAFMSNGLGSAGIASGTSSSSAAACGASCGLGMRNVAPHFLHWAFRPAASAGAFSTVLQPGQGTSNLAMRTPRRGAT